MLHEEVSAPKSVKEDEILAEWNVEFSKVEKSLNGDFKEHLPNVNGFVRSEPGGFFMMDEYARHAEKVYRFQPRNDDVWVVTFPKCGKYIFQIFFSSFGLKNISPSCS